MTRTTERSDAVTPTTREACSGEGAGQRRIERTVRIAAPPAAVWRALTDADELVRWFPLEARVKPGAGGSIWMGWEGQYEFDTPIDVWEPERRLRQMVPGTPVAIEFTLEPSGRGTLLRLVHSGFGRGAGWDEELDATTRGWRFELEALRLYLELHRGRDRSVAWARVLSDVPAGERWSRVVDGGGVVDGASLATAFSGSRFRAVLPGGHPLEGRVLTFEPPKEVSLAVEEPAPGILRVNVDDLPMRGVADVNVWFSAYGMSRSEAEELRDEWVRRLLDRLPGARLPAAAVVVSDPSFGAGGGEPEA